MPLKLSIGLSRKVGLPNYGSLGATCGLEVELPAAALADREAFERQVRDAFAACERAVRDELERHRPAPGAPNRDEDRDADDVPDGQLAPGGGADRRPHRPATGAQLRALRALCGRRGVELEALVGERFGVAGREGLSAAEAGRLIDELQAPAELPA